MITQRQTNSLWKGSVVGSVSNSFRIETSVSISDCLSLRALELK